MPGREGRGDTDADGPPPRACTLIACAAGVRVRLGGLPAAARSARVCVAGRCGPVKPIERSRPLTARLPRSQRTAGRVVQISIRLIDGQGQTVSRVSRRATVRRTRPNGPDCPPVCYQAVLHLGGPQGWRLSHVA